MFSLFRNSFFVKVFLVLFSLTSFIMIVFSIQSSKFQKESMIKSLYSETKTIADAIKFFSEDDMLANNEIDILEFNYDYVQANPQIKKLILSKKNTKATIISKQNWLIEKIDDSIFSLHENEKEDYKIIYDKKLQAEVFHYSYPVIINTINWGWIHISLSLDKYKKEVNQMYGQFMYLSIFLFFITSFISYLVAKAFSSQIIKLDVASKRILNGDLSNRVEITSKDEIGNFASTFNKMLDNLEKSQNDRLKAYENLENIVDLRTQELKNANNELNKKTDELKDLNDNLINKVNEEIKKQQVQEQMLIQQSKLAAMGEMIGNIAHQWRQPLNALGLVVQNISLSYELDELDDDFMKRAVNKATTLTKTMSKTIDDFRDFFKPNKEKSLFSLEESVKKSLFLIESSFSSANIKIDSSYDEMKDIIGIQSELSQALLNILNNAKDALVENKIKNSLIKINVYEESDYACISIEDNANGINEDILNKIYEPYFTTKEEGKGTGIGLYMTKIIIEENLGGNLSVENINNGVKFIIKLPKIIDF